jgi:hypothetical protein
MMFEYTVYITLILNPEIGLSYVTFRDREKCIHYMQKVDPLLWTDAYCYKMYKFKDTLPLPASTAQGSYATAQGPRATEVIRARKLRHFDV